MTTQPSELRIIAGQHRGRKILFHEEEGLRPTHNRIRETLFNWLQPVIENSVCLDVFAGSGALGFEALSRGAKRVTFMDISVNVVNQLRQNAENLKIENADFLRCDFISRNMLLAEKFDIIFLDPPFHQSILLPACELLVTRKLLKPNSLIYLECQKGSVDFSKLPGNWVIQKHKHTQTVEYLLCGIR